MIFAAIFSISYSNDIRGNTHADCERVTWKQTERDRKKRKNDERKEKGNRVSDRQTQKMGRQRVRESENGAREREIETRDGARGSW